MAALLPPPSSAAAAAAVPSQAATLRAWWPRIRARGRVYLKTRPMLARRAAAPGVLRTALAGKTETTNSFAAGDWILLGSEGERYALSQDAFRHRYHADDPRPFASAPPFSDGVVVADDADADGPDGLRAYRAYRPRGAVAAVRVTADEIDLHFPQGRFVASWGAAMLVEPGDYLGVPMTADQDLRLTTAPSEIYRIEAQAFAATYSPRSPPRGRRAAKSAAALTPAHARTLAELLAEWMAPPALSDAELAAAFILAALALRRAPKSWAVGPLPSPLVADQPPNKPEGAPTSLGDVAGLVDVLLGPVRSPAKLLRWCSSSSSSSSSNPSAAALPASPSSVSAIPLRTVFARLRLAGQKTHVNRAVCGWLDGLRPLVLLHRIPSPTDVLEMQSRGQRVCTLFLGEDDLAGAHVSPLAYMEGDHAHARDALDFLTHDLSHIELFCDPTTFAEQVGFFAGMRGLDPTGQGRPYRFFRRYCPNNMQALWPQLQYCFSDMNCWSTHLLAYLKAKWLMVADGGFAEGWPALLDALRLAPGSPARAAADAMCGGGSGGGGGGGGGGGDRTLRQRFGAAQRQHFSHPALSLEAAAFSSNFAPRPTDVFVCTAPKTGTTLLQQICQQLKETCVPQQTQDYDDIYQVSPFLDMAWDLGDAHCAALDGLPAPRVFKSHQRLSVLVGRPGGERGGEACRYLCAVRDPADTLLSWYNFLWRRRAPVAVACAAAGGGGVGAFARNAEWFAGGMRYGASLWEYYVEFYRAATAENVLVLVFEELARDVRGHLPDVARFLMPDAGALREEQQLLDTVAERCGKAWMARHGARFDESWAHAQIVRAGRARDPEAFRPSPRVVQGTAEGSGGHAVAADTVPAETRAWLQTQWAERVAPATGCATYAEFARRLSAMRRRGTETEAGGRQETKASSVGSSGAKLTAAQGEALRRFFRERGLAQLSAQAKGV